MRTGDKNQQAMFLQNLWKSIDKLSSNSSKTISKMASQYTADGHDTGEIIELLVADGFESHAARSFVDKMSAKESDDEQECQEWGFEAEELIHGDIVTNYDIGCSSITATNHDEAMEVAQNFIDENCSDQYSVTKVYLIG